MFQNFYLSKRVISITIYVIIKECS